jgi:hypothetical protein
MTSRRLALIAGISYLVIFFAAIFANFFVLEAIKQDPLLTITQSSISVRFGIFAFLLAAVFDVIVAWALYELYREHYLSNLSTYFRLIHAAIMGLGIFALFETLVLTTAQEILQQVELFNLIWLIGLFFFGIHLILLSVILKRPKFIVLFLGLAGIMYMVDSAAHFLLPNYEDYASVLLIMVAIPSIVGEMSLAVWLLIKGGKRRTVRGFVKEN